MWWHFIDLWPESVSFYFARSVAGGEGNCGDLKCWTKKEIIIEISSHFKTSQELRRLRPTQVTCKFTFKCHFCPSCPRSWPPWPPWQWRPWWTWRLWWPWQPRGSWRLYIRNFEIIWGSWRLYTSLRLSDQMSTHCQVDRCKWWIISHSVSHHCTLLAQRAKLCFKLLLLERFDENSKHKHF